ncbi:MAG: hypothetical protein Q8O88_02180, partial [bacterium]|nr:hypothetical protein [bacterium]
MSKKYFLYLDDLRDPFKETKWPDHIYTLQTVIVRGYNEFVKCITEKGLPDTVSFDFDLAPEHYKQGDKSHFTSIEGYEKLFIRNGLDCAKFLINYCETHKEKLPVFY